MNSSHKGTPLTALLPGWLVRNAGRITAAEVSGRFAWSLLFADFLGSILILSVFYVYAQKRVFDPEQVGVIAIGIVVCNFACLSYRRSAPHALAAVLFRTLAAAGLAVLTLPLAARLDAGLESSAIRAATAFCYPLIGLLRLIHARTCAFAPLEALRCTIIGGGALAAGFPLLTSVTVGTGDAYWYGNMVGDFVQQWRAGVFPVFVGQTDYAFNGAITPLRYAPYLQHAAGILDLLTFRTLTNAGLVNLILVLSLLGAGFATYFCLAAITIASRWLPCLFALLVISSPAVLSLVYTGDLFMSVCALPYLPLIFYGIWRTFRDHDFSSVYAMTVPLAAAWLCHPPIAFWAGVIAALSQIMRLAGRVKNFNAWRAAIGGAGVFFVLTAGAFVSVFTLQLPALVAEPPLIVQSLLNAFPGALLPISDGAGALSDYQLGWSLWWALIGGAVAVVTKPRGFNLSLLVGGLLLLALLLPIAPLLDFLWIKTVPQTVANITFLWPMQRFYVILAIITVFLAAIACDYLVHWRTWLNLPILALLFAGLAWSAQEAVPFLLRGAANTEPISRYRVAQLPENRVLTRYAFSPFSVVPPYFSHGFIEPTWETRLLDFSSLEETDSNYRAAIGPKSIVRASGEMTASADAPGALSYVLLRDLPLAAGRRYALEFQFNHPDVAGTLLAGSQNLARNYLLPNSGAGIATPSAPSSFGSLGPSKKAFSLFVSGVSDQKLETIQFWATAPPAMDITNYGRYWLREYEIEDLPVSIESWIPIRARVTVEKPTWLETPRIFLEGYRAQVNGRDVSVGRSPAGLVMVPLASGRNSVIVDYPGPPVLRWAYFLSLAGWLGVLSIGMRNLIHRLGSPSSSRVTGALSDTDRKATD